MKSEIIGLGTYTDYVGNAPGACGEGILLLSFCNTDGIITSLDNFKIINPSYLSWSESSKTLCSCNEKEDGTGQINSFSINDDYKIIPRNNTDSRGSALCFISQADKDGNLFATSYRDGAIYKINQKESELSIIYRYKYTGNGPNTERQEQPHAHQVVQDLRDKYIYICDLGSDKIWIEEIENNKPSFKRFLDVPGGYGPRHLIFNKSGEYQYILCELEPRILVTKVDTQSGELKIINDYSSTMVSREKSAPAAIKLHPSGKTLAVSNRVINTISIFKVLDDQLLFIEEFSCRGDHPRDINFTEAGDWLLIANQDSNDIQIRAFDKDKGEPKDHWASPYNIGTPTCIINIDSIN